MFGYLLPTAWLNQQLARPVDHFTLVRILPDLWRHNPDLTLQIALILAASALGFFAFGAHNASESLTTLGTSSWQSMRQMRRNGLLGTPGTGFVLAKTSGPTCRGRYITSDAHPNALIVAPTGAGKGVGFV
jgi:type IV secretion system protein VirD4